MTSEVLIFNKRAVVLAADSAVTSSGTGPSDQPRYSKTANKIFELSDHGNVAVAIFGGASIDLVPWELAIKLFRKSLGTQTFPTVAEYLDHLIAYLSGNTQLFPPELLDRFREYQFDEAAAAVAERARLIDPDLVDPAIPLQDRRALWTTAHAQIRDDYLLRGVKPTLSDMALADELANGARWVPRIQAQLYNVPGLEAINPGELAELAHLNRYACADERIGYTGVAVAGFGEAQIFPAYRLCHIHGHVGSELFWTDVKSEEITHETNSLIVPLAQTSMIDLFTRGFGISLWSIVGDANRVALEGVLSECKGKGLVLGPDEEAEIASRFHQSFMDGWIRKNWNRNYTPLIGVLATLSVEEMAHLAETLLVLESLKERVTSSSEEIGGPIDVAAITKSEGMLWLKRKHFFAAETNMRYTMRLQRSLNH